MTQKQYCDFSADLATPRQRSIRINGFATCLRLEEIYWRIIEVLAEREAVTVGKLLSRWAMEMDLSCEVVRNFTGYVRVTCVVQLARQAISVGTKELTLLLSAISSTVEP